MEIKAIIFDLDGTLVDTIEDIGASANILFRRHGYPEHNREEFIQWIGNGAAKFVEEGLGVELHEERLKNYVDEFKEIYSTNYNVKSSLYKGIGELLDYLEEKSVKMSVLSNKPHHLTVKVTDSYLKSWGIDPVFGQREEVPRKPDPAAAYEISEMIGCKPSEIMFIGDSEGDVKTAMAAGMIPVGVTWGYGDVTLAKEKGFDTVDTPKELLKLISKI